MAWIARLLLVVIVLAPPAHAAAEEIPGARDPELQAAVDLWLAGEDATALPALGALARSGNVAARLFLGSARSRNDRFAYSFQFTTEERMAIFFALPLRSWTYFEARSGNRFARLLRKTPISADVVGALLAAGERQRALSYLPALKDLMSIRDTELRHIVYGRARFDDLPILDVWTMKVFLGEWTAEDEAVYRRALEEERLAAILFQGADLRSYRGVTRRPPATAGPIHLLLRGRMTPEEVTPELLDRAAALLAAEAERSSFLWPMRNLCREACPGSVERCMVSVATRPGGSVKGLAYRDSPLESVISQERYLASARARLELLTWLAYYREREPRGPTVACLRAAIDAFAEAHPLAMR